jgi:hypothetical protein
MTVLLSILRAPSAAAGLDIAGWDLLLRQAVAANLSASLVYLLEQAGVLGQVPAQPRCHLEWARTLAERHRRGVAYEVRQLQLALAATGAPVILLKGAAYAVAGLAPADGRLFSDIDILVPREQLDAVEHALLKGGWVSTHTDPYDQRYYREWMHELPPMQHMRSQGMVDVHHAILPRTAALQPDPAKLRAAAVPIGAGGLFALAPPDMVLHSAVHLFHDGEFDRGLRDLLDIHRLLQEFAPAPGFWDSLPVRARELGLGRPLFYALRYSMLMLGTPVPSQVVVRSADWAPVWPLRLLMDQLFTRALLPQHASCDSRLGGLARFFLYLRANWLRMPPLMLARHLLRKALVPARAAAPERVAP